MGRPRTESLKDLKALIEKEKEAALGLNKHYANTEGSD
jgi:hypothetical protein